MLCFYLLPGSRGVADAHEPVFAAAVRRRYSRLLPHALRHPRTVRLEEEGRSRGDQAVAAMEDTHGVVDLALEPQSDIPTLRVGFDRAVLARHGLPAREAALTLHGREVGQIFDGQIAVPLVVRRETSLTIVHRYRQLALAGGRRVVRPLEALP